MYLQSILERQRVEIFTFAQAAIKSVLILLNKVITTQLRGANPQQTIKNFGVNDMSDNTESGRVSIQLQRELDGANNMMCFWVDDTEISHYLMSHINDKGNMEDWQESLCVNAAFVIDELRSEVKRLRSLIAD